MKKNDGCEYCKKDCKDKSKNAYKYCPDYSHNENKRTQSEYDFPEEINKMFGGIFK